MPRAARVVGQSLERRAERPRSNVDIRRLYKTARWQRLREQKQYDNPFCVDCQAEGHLELWTDLDHVVPHRGDWMRFWDYDNLAGLCHRHHSRKTQRGA